jgi:hypothetical protein
LAIENKAKDPGFLSELAFALNSTQILSGVGLNLILGLATVGFSFWYRHHQIIRRELGFIGSLLVVHVPLYFLGLFLVAWLLADQTCTNLLGIAPAAVKKHLEQGINLAQILKIRSYVLAFLATIIAVGFETIGLEISRIKTAHFFLPHLIMSVVPVGAWMFMGNIASVIFFCKQMPLKERLKRRHTWPRWFVNLALPYLLAFIVLPIAAWPMLLANHARHRGITNVNLISSIALLIWNAVLWKVGYELANILLVKRSNKIISLLQDN